MTNMEFALSANVRGRIGSDGNAALNGIGLAFVERAWLAYALAKEGAAAQAEPIVAGLERELAKRMAAEAGGDAAMEAAYWLWAYGFSRSAGASVAAAAATLAEAIGIVAAGWRAPRAHWLAASGGSGEAAVWFANLAVMYGGLLAVQPYAPEAGETIQQALIAMRELTFAKFIREEKIVSRLGSGGIDGDIVLAAVPFGLLGIEDRILVEALFVAERELASEAGIRLSEADGYYGGCERPDLTALLALYYAEKGELARAAALLAGIERQLARNGGELRAVDEATAREPLYAAYWRERAGERPPLSPLALLLHAVAARTLAEKRSGGFGAASGGVRALHVPTGRDDPYVRFANERLPRHPAAGDLVRVRATTQPFRPEQRVVAKYRIGGEADWREAPAALGRSAEGEPYWEAELGRFGFGETVAYRFEVDGEAGVSGSGGEAYAFRVRDWLPLGAPASWAAIAEGGLRLAFAPSAALPDGGALVFDGGARDRALAIRFEGGAAQAQAGALVLPEGAFERTERFGDWELRLSRPEGGQLDYAIAYRGGEPLLRSYGRNGVPALELLSDGERLHGVRFSYRLEAADRVYGMGERYSRFEYRGISVDNYVYNEYRSQGMRTYIPVPFVVNARGYGLFANTTMYAVFDFGESLADRMLVQTDIRPDTPSIELIVMPGEPFEAVRTYTDVTGKPALPPKWAFGPWMSSNNWDSQAEALKQAELTKRHAIPATVFVLEQWSDEATFYIFNDAQYETKDGREALRYEDYAFPEWGRWPDPKSMVRELHDDGLKVLLWQIPIEKHMYGVAHGQKDADERAMLEAGYHVREANGEPYRIPYNWFKDSLVIDFTNEEARRWWFEKRKYLLTDIGVDGFKTDGGECVFGSDLAFADGSVGAEMRNRYPNDYIGSYYAFVQEHAPGGGITFSRAGYAGAQRHPLHWAGDERSTFDAFRSSLHAGLSSGLSGIPFWGWDLAGFHGDIPTAELYIRSAQMAAFCPVMQYHAETKGEFNQDRTPWNIAERTGRPDVIAIYKRYADVRMNLLPYIYASAIESAREGVPMMRPMFAAFPHDPSVAAAQYGQYLFGGSLLVAPVIEEGDSTKNVFFPAGCRWLPLLEEGDPIEGGRYRTVQADLADIPVYLRENAVLPLNLNASLTLGGHVGSRVDAYDRLTFCLYVTSETAYVFEDDLGEAIGLAARRSGDRLTIEYRSSGRAEAPVLWLRGEASAAVAVEVADEAGPFERTTVERLGAGSYASRGGDTLIALRSGASATIAVRYGERRKD